MGFLLPGFVARVKCHVTQTEQQRKTRTKPLGGQTSDCKILHRLVLGEELAGSLCLVTDHADFARG